MESFSASIIEFLSGVSPLLQLSILFFFSFAEGLPVIGSVLPGGTIAIFAGTLVEQGTLSLLVTILVIGISSFLGDMTGFFLGKRFKHFRYIKRIVEDEKHKKTWDLFDRHLMLISIFGRLIPVVRSAPSILAAFRGVKTRTYIVYSFLGSMLWAVLGIYAGKLIEKFLGERAISLIFMILAASIVFVVGRIMFKKFSKRLKAR